MTPRPAGFLGAPLAHRALHDIGAGRPENSRAAIRAAIAAGYGIEIDLQLSRDGCAMVFHDYDLRRLAGRDGAVRQCDAADLGRIPLLGGDADETIPGFAEVLDLVAGRVPLLVELKDQHGQMGVTDGRLERAVADDVRGYAGPVALMSFNPNSVVMLADLVSDIPRGLVTEAFAAHHWPLLKPRVRSHLRGIPDYVRAGASFVSHSIHDLDNPRLGELAGEGGAVLCWTVRSPVQERAARRRAANITFEGYDAPIPA